MEKLLRDLNIYAHSFMNCNLTFTYDGNRIIVQWDEIWPYVAESIILNKRFWFIKWLVENEKIDLDKAKILDNWNKAELFEFIDRADYMKIRNRSYFSEYKQLLMLLSIQDNPIEFLVSILK